MKCRQIFPAFTKSHLKQNKRCILVYIYILISEQNGSGSKKRGYLGVRSGFNGTYAIAGSDLVRLNWSRRLEENRLNRDLH